MDFYNIAMNHRTIRKFKNKEVDKETFDKIVSCALRTASSVGMQQSSIIVVTDEEKKKQIAELCYQDYIAAAPHLFIFVLDMYRNRKIYEEKAGELNPESDVDKFFQAFSDTILMAQNTNNLVESLGLGGMFLGSVLNDAEKMIEILDLPELTLPVLGYGFGYPDDNPEIKPRMPKEYRVFENSYKKEENYLEALKDYDEKMKEYYAHREKNSRVDSFTDQVVKINNFKLPKRAMLLDIARKNGFKL